MELGEILTNESKLWQCGLISSWLNVKLYQNFLNPRN